MDIKQIYKTIDRFFKDNNPKEAEHYIKSVLDEAMEQQDNTLVLYMLNELIGYYRQTSMKTELLDVIERSLSLIKEMKIDETVEGATTLLNAATGYRSVGMFDDARACYNKTEQIYKNELDEKDMLYAGLYNNQSLLEQEMGNYETALTYQKKAIEIVLYNNAGFQIAVTYTNIANTYITLKDYTRAKENANLAVAKYKERNLEDSHYCAAISVLGLCEMHSGNREKAREYFATGMNIIERKIGRNAQYERMKEYYDMCGIADKENTGVSGLCLCRQYFEECGKPMIQERFPQYIHKIAVGLVGEGSDCFGFDDEYSKDHDWGPGFCMWVTRDTYEEIGKELEDAYETLPKEYRGYKRVESPQGQNRTGVFVISDFYEKFVGVKLALPEDVSLISYENVEDYNLACAVNGEVFCDDEGIFSSIRDILKRGYPERIQYLKLAESMTKFAQTAQYNYKRMCDRGDYLTADRMLINGIYHAMEVIHIMNQSYIPHEKWLLQSTKRLAGCDELLSLILSIHSFVGKHEEYDIKQACNAIEQLGAGLARQLYGRNIISDLNPYLAYHQEELLIKAQNISLSHEEIVEKIARLEFKAFDKVKNEGGRAYCQNDWPTFSVMRKSQYLTWNHTMLVQYIYDFTRELSMGHNLITEKYGRMMESTAPERYEEIKDNFPALSEQKKGIIEQIVAVQMSMMEEFAIAHPNVADNARSIHTYEDNRINTSYETYLRGEISTYSDKMLQLYAAYVIEKATNNENIARLTIENTAKLYGYKSLEAFEKSVN